VLSKGICAEHGKVKGKYDLRIKAVFDDGARAHETVMNCAMTEKVLGITLEDAVLMATETLDPECVNDLIKREFLGKYYDVRGFKTDRFIIAESVEPANPASPQEAVFLRELIEEELKMKAGADEVPTGADSEIVSDFEEFERMLASMETSDDAEEMDFAGRGVI
ncbi:MAG: hypothetical protein FWE78_01880, partial [Methanimicrococcus sp.]|nr:hypothetical protein [Methanimicrococcus sp.]